MLTPKTSKSDALQAPSAEDSATNLCLNLMPIDCRLTEAEMCFTCVPLGGLYSVKPGEVPEELTGSIPAGKMPDRFFTSALPKGPGLAVKVALNRHPALARLWCMQQIRHQLKRSVAYMDSCGRFTTRVWCTMERLAAGIGNGGGTADAREAVSPGRQAFHRFTLRVLHRRAWPHPLLLIGYSGIGYVLTSSLEELAGRNPDTRTIRRLAFRKQICRWEELPVTAFYHPNEIHPLPDKKVARWLQLTTAPKNGNPKPGNDLSLIAAFLKTHLPVDPPSLVTLHREGLLEATAHNTGRVSSATGQLLFGEGGVSDKPVEGMATYGPLKLPRGIHFSCFIVCFEEEKQLAQKLTDSIISTDASRRLGHFMRVPLCLSFKHNICLSAGIEAEVQLSQRLTQMVFDPKITWCAFYLCPGKGQMPRRQTRRLHARISELLLHRGVLVQKIPVPTLESDFAEPSRLAMDVVARMGGLPWRPQGNNLNDPVVGFGVRPFSNPPGCGTGAAAFFAPGGQFSGASSFNPANEREWGGLSMEFFRQWEMSGGPANRLVLHLPRRLKKQARQSLLELVNEAKPELQVVTMVIRRCRSRHIRAFNRCNPGAGVPDGTWVRCSNSRYLLYTSGTPCGSDRTSRAVMPLRVRFCILNAGNDTIGQLAPGLLDQLHAYTRMHRPGGSSAYLPATLTYPALLARLIPRLRNRTLPEFERQVPWFL